MTPFILVKDSLNTFALKYLPVIGNNYTFITENAF